MVPLDPNEASLVEHTLDSEMLGEKEVSELLHGYKHHKESHPSLSLAVPKLEDF
jgi:hypothetical protein